MNGGKDRRRSEKRHGEEETNKQTNKQTNNKVKKGGRNERSQSEMSALNVNAAVFTPRFTSPPGGADSSEAKPASAPSPVKEQVNQQHESKELSIELMQDEIATNSDLFICCIDVECVASGKRNTDRVVARVALVDQNETVLFDRLVKPDVPIVSYLTPLTGLEPGSLDDAESLECVREDLLKVLPKDSLLVGQAIQHDIHWLQLEQGVHFKHSFDIGKFFRLLYKNGRERYFSLRHEVLHLTGFEGAGQDIQSGVHDPCVDAVYSIRLFNKYKTSSEMERQIAQQTLARVPATPPFWKLMPLIDGVQMGPAHHYA